MIFNFSTFSLIELQKMREELQHKLVKMVADPDAIAQLQAVEEEIQRRKDQ